VAAVGALAVGWLATHFEAAVNEIRTVARLAVPDVGAVAALTPAFMATDAAALHRQAARSALHQRGPPGLLRVSPA
jgi:hypothetical protein